MVRPTLVLGDQDSDRVDRDLQHAVHVRRVEVMDLACAELVDASSAAGVPHHVGVIRSVDALYSDLMPDRMPRSHHLREELEMWSRAGVISNDMETSTLFVVARLRKLRAGTINLCVDELGAGEIHHLDPSYMDRMLRVAVDAIRRLIAKDKSAAHR